MIDFKKDIKGITLTSLIITVIIMLILAGTTLNIVNKSNLFSRTLESKKLAEQEKVNLSLASFNISSPYTFDKHMFENAFKKNGFNNSIFVYTGNTCYFTSDSNNTYKINLSTRSLDKSILKVDNEKISTSTVNLNMTVAWIDEDTAEVAVDGKVYANTFITVDQAGGIVVKASAKEVASDKPIFKSGEKVFIEYNYISGTAPGKAFTIKYRDTSPNSVAINTAELIANHSKQNFDLYSSFRNSGTLTTDVSALSIYMANDCELKDFVFSLSFGKED